MDLIELKTTEQLAPNFEAVFVETWGVLIASFFNSYNIMSL